MTKRSVTPKLSTTQLATLTVLADRGLWNARRSAWGQPADKTRRTMEALERRELVRLGADGETWSTAPLGYLVLIHQVLESLLLLDPLLPAYGKLLDRAAQLAVMSKFSMLTGGPVDWAARSVTVP